jgi:hypothetical protein
MNIHYISRLTDEEIEEDNADEYMSIYLSVARNIKVYSSVIRNQGIYWEPLPPRPGHVYI